MFNVIMRKRTPLEHALDLVDKALAGKCDMIIDMEGRLPGESDLLPEAVPTNKSLSKSAPLSDNLKSTSEAVLKRHCPSRKDLEAIPDQVSAWRTVYRHMKIQERLLHATEQEYARLIKFNVDLDEQNVALRKEIQQLKEKQPGVVSSSQQAKHQLEKRLASMRNEMKNLKRSNQKYKQSCDKAQADLRKLRELDLDEARAKELLLKKISKLKDEVSQKDLEINRLIHLTKIMHQANKTGTKTVDEGPELIVARSRHLDKMDYQAQRDFIEIVVEELDEVGNDSEDDRPAEHMPWTVWSPWIQQPPAAA